MQIIKNIVFASIFIALILNFAFSLLKKWKAFEYWDVYIPFKRCMFCLSWWASLAFCYAITESPFQVPVEWISNSMCATTLTYYMYARNN